jgi:hypothetical protein
MGSKMNIEDIKFYAVNLSAVGFGLVDINVALTTLTLLVGLGYSLHKWYLLTKKRRAN